VIRDHTSSAPRTTPCSSIRPGPPPCASDLRGGALVSPRTGSCSTGGEVGGSAIASSTSLTRARHDLGDWYRGVSRVAFLLMPSCSRSWPRADKQCQAERGRGAARSPSRPPVSRSSWLSIGLRCRVPSSSSWRMVAVSHMARRSRQQSGVSFGTMLQAGSTSSRRGLHPWYRSTRVRFWPAPRRSTYGVLVWSF